MQKGLNEKEIAAAFARAVMRPAAAGKPTALVAHHEQEEPTSWGSWLLRAAALGGAAYVGAGIVRNYVLPKLGGGDEEDTEHRLVCGIQTR